MSKVLHKMNNAVMDGGDKLQNFAKVAGMSGSEFAETWKKDPYLAVQQFEEGLDEQNRKGKDVKGMLESLGITELRETDTVLRLANGHKQMAAARKYANDGYKKGTALSNEAQQKYKTLGNQLKIFVNHIKTLGMELGASLAPAIIGIMKVLTPLIDALAKAPQPVKFFVAALALIPVALGPIALAASGVVGVLGLLGQSMLVAEKAATSSARGMRIFSATYNLVTSPVSTVKSRLAQLAMTFRATGTAARTSARDVGFFNSVLGTFGIGATKTGKKVGLTTKIFGALKNTFKFLIPVGGILAYTLEVIGAALGLILTPIGAVVAAVAAIGAGFYLAYKKVKWFRDGVNGLLYTLKVFGGGILGGIVKGLRALGGAFLWVGNQVKDKATKAIKAWWNALPDNGQVKTSVRAIQMVGNGFKNVMKTLGTATHKATDTTNVLGKGVSKGTRQALSKFVEYSKQSSKILSNIKNHHGKITTEEKNKLLSIQKDTTDNLISELHKRAKKQQEIQKSVFAKNSGLSAKQEQDIMKRTQKTFSDREKRIKDIGKRINELVKKQARDGKLSGSEMKELNKLYREQEKLAVGTLSKTHKEQQRILSRMSVNRKAYNMQEAQSIVKESVKARDAAKKENKKQYDAEVDHINEMVGLSKSEKEKMLADAEDRYKKANAKADKNHKKVMTDVKKSNKDIENEMDLSNGKVYTNAEKWWKKTKSLMSNRFWNKNEVVQQFKDAGKDIANAWKSIKGIDWGSLWGNIKGSGKGIGNWFAQQGHQFATAFKGGWDKAMAGLGNMWSGIKGVSSDLGLWFAEKGRQWYSNFKNSWEATKKTAGDLWNGMKNSNLGQWFAQKGQQWYTNFKTQWDATKQTMGDLWAGIKSTGANLGGWFAAKGRSFFSSLKAGWNNALTTGGNLWNGFVSFLGKTWGGIRSWFVNKGKQMLNAVVTGWRSMSAGASAIFSGLWTRVKAIWSGIYNTIKYWSGAAWNRVKAVWSWIRNFTGKVFGGVWAVTRKIWSGIKGTITYWTGAIWNRIKAVFGWIRNHIGKSLTVVWSTVRRIWKGIKGTITYWTGAIWSRIKAVFNWIKNHIGKALTIAWTTTKRIWKGIKGTISYWTGAIWGRVKSIFNRIRSTIHNVLSSIWKTVKRIWKGIFGTIGYWLSHTLSKVKNIWSNIKHSIGSMAQGAWNAVKSKFHGMYTSAKYWIDRIGEYIHKAKSWMKNKAIALGKGVANGAIWGLNKMIGGINAISKAITSKGLIKKIPTLSTGTRKGKPKSNSKGQLRKPTPAVVNDKGRGNGKGRNGHQEVIRRSDGSMFAPQGKNVLVNLNKGDTVFSGAETQSMQNSGVIPRFASGTKKKNLLNAVGEEFTKFVSKAKSTGKHAGDVIGDKTKDIAKGVKNGVKSGVKKAGDVANAAKDKAGDAIGSVMTGIKGVVKNVEDWMEKPKALVDLVMKKFGVFFGKGKNTTIDMAKGAYEKLKVSLVDKVKEWFEDSFGGGGGYNPYAKNSNFTFVRGWTPSGHAGIDYAAKTGTPIPSPINGTVIKSWFSPNQPSGGNETQVYDGSKYTHIFMHQSKRKVKEGQKVHQGQIIGEVGNTGNSFGSHLHWQVNKGKGYLNNHPDSIDPIKWAKQAGKGQNKDASAWKPDIRRAAKQMKVNLSSRELNGIVAQIQRESNGNAGVTQGNIGDINNLRGTPAQGLLQYVPSTFRSYAVRGHKNIKNGYDQLLAFFNNSNWRRDLPYGRSGWGPSGRRRFAHGGMIKKHGLYEAGEGNRPEMVLPLTNKSRSMQLIEQAKTFMGVDEPSVNIDGTSNDNSNLIALLQKNNELLSQLISVVASKELKLDKNAMVDTVNKELGNKYKSRSYARGGY